jgi:hypothetical protein
MFGARRGVQEGRGMGRRMRKKDGAGRGDEK